MSDIAAKAFRTTNPAQPEHLRERDNAAPTHKPRSWMIRPAPNLAPTGMSGIRKNLPTHHQRSWQADTPTAFAIGNKGHLAKSFKPIVEHGHNTEIEWER